MKFCFCTLQEAEQNGAKSKMSGKSTCRFTFRRLTPALERKRKYFYYYYFLCGCHLTLTIMLMNTHNFSTLRKKVKLLKLSFVQNNYDRVIFYTIFGDITSEYNYGKLTFFLFLLLLQNLFTHQSLPKT